MADAAVIFDVDGVLLDLTAAEEDAFFRPFERRYGLAGLSRDWDSYPIRNDEEIVGEILDRHGLPRADAPAVAQDYFAELHRIAGPVEIAGARQLLHSLAGLAALAIATANFREAARIRLARAGLWGPVADRAFGADGGGHKRDIVARAVVSLGLPVSRIVYVGDNLNDLEAGLANGTHFIGFSLDAERRERLAAAGARHVSSGHQSTREIIRDLLGGL